MENISWKGWGKPTNRECLEAERIFEQFFKVRGPGSDPPHIDAPLSAARDASALGDAVGLTLVSYGDVVGILEEKKRKKIDENFKKNEATFSHFSEIIPKIENLKFISFFEMHTN